jgi:2-polyprenyl-6-methoxyphenol hydroxylase-like FAD-dependent oxidoreductase
VIPAIAFEGDVAPGHLVEYDRLHKGRTAALHVWATDCRRQPGDAADPPLVRATLGAAQAQGVRPVIDDLLMVNLAPWHRGRCVRLGDAAHGITLISGQGAGMALASAATLAQAVGNAASIETRLVDDRARKLPAISRLQQHNRSIARWFVPHTAFACAARNAVVRATSRPLLTRYVRNSLRAEIDRFAALPAPG